jgi:hypothetical protein
MNALDVAQRTVPLVAAFAGAMAGRAGFRAGQKVGKPSPSRQIVSGRPTTLPPEADMARFRLRAGLAPDDTVAMVRVNGRRYFGVNSSAQAREALALRREFLIRIQQELGELQGRPLNRVQALLHAEANSLMRASVRVPELPKSLLLSVDRRICNFCVGKKGLPLMMRLLDVEELTIVSPTWTVGLSGLGDIGWQAPLFLFPLMQGK